MLIERKTAAWAGTATAMELAMSQPQTLARRDMVVSPCAGCQRRRSPAPDRPYGKGTFIETRDRDVRCWEKFGGVPGGSAEVVLRAILHNLGPSELRRFGGAGSGHISGQSTRTAGPDGL